MAIMKFFLPNHGGSPKWAPHQPIVIKISYMALVMYKYVFTKQFHSSEKTHLKSSNPVCM